jgi:signal transduction histidine kinase
METGTPELHIIEPQQQADGKAAWLDTNKIPLHNSEGQVTGILGTFEDITKRKLVEEELTRYRHQLEELVKEQTDTLEKTQAELLQRERLATLGKVTATVSHELRNPLATIQSSLFSIEENLERNEPLQVFRSLQLAERSIQRCVKIIEELNSYARVKPLEVSQTDVDEWLKDLLKELDFPAEISFKLDLSIGGKVTLDQEKLRQVIVNLVNNSVHALQESASVKKHLQISSRLLDDKYELCFNDNGTGMSEETKEKLFEPLFSTKGFGVGLGMVIVKNIVEQHHGEIFIESIEKEGTTVTLRLPVRVQSV